MNPIHRSWFVFHGSTFFQLGVHILGVDLIVFNLPAGTYFSLPLLQQIPVLRQVVRIKHLDSLQAADFSKQGPKED